MTRITDDHCEITMILDRSGSMAGIKSDAEGGYKHFIETQKNQPGTAHLTLMQFDSEAIDTLYEGDLAGAPTWTCNPRGLTPLLDAVGQAIARLEARVMRMPSVPTKVVFVILTDGQENHSVEWTKERLKARIKDAQMRGWGVVFLGVGIDAFAEAGQYGVYTASTAQSPHTPTGINQAFAAAAGAVSTYRASSGSGETLSSSAAPCPIPGCIEPMGHAGDHKDWTGRVVNLKHEG